jgi:hypothetical protein
MHVGTNITAAPAAGVYPGTPTSGTAFASPWASQNASVQNGTALGAAFSGSTTTGAVSGGFQWATTQASGTTLVTSPLTGACSGCHDSSQAIAHMTGTGGGSWYVARSTVTNASGALVNNEQCLVCHGPGTVQDIYTVHMNFAGAGSF